MIKLSDYIISFLEEKGIKHIFMLPGGGAMHLVDSVGKSQNLSYVCCRHEQAIAIAAEGYYRASGRLAAVVVTTGPGGTNTLTGVIGQWLDSIPCIYISGQLKRAHVISAYPELGLRQLGDQEINIVDIVKPVTKYAETVQKAEKIKYHLEKALYLATHGRPGPVWLDIPLDIQASIIEPSKLPDYYDKEDEIIFDKDLIKKQVTELLSRIRKAERPVILAGHGIRIAGAEEVFLKLVEKLKIPVLTAICGHDLIWSDHPLFFGRPGICGDRWGNFVQQNCDLFISIGTRLGIRQISYSCETFAREAYRAMVDIDEAELNKPTLYPDMRVHADAKFFLEEMLLQTNGETIEPKQSWLSWCRERKNTLPSILQDNPSNHQYVNSYSFADSLFDLLKPGSLVVTGNGTAYTGTFQIMNLKKGVRVFTNQGCASMGYDIPAAIGACFARNKEPVVLITGDGSIEMNIQELATIDFHKLPIKIFVLNNEGYLAMRITQDTYFEGRYIASDPRDGISFPNLCRVAEAYGVKTVKLDNENNMSAKIGEILSMPGPVLCEVFMDPKQTLYPKLSSEVKPDGKIVSKPLEDLYPFLSRDEFKKNMMIKPLDE
jgi:acetolactate synthase-1/2/3 large subunit